MFRQLLGLVFVLGSLWAAEPRPRAIVLFYADDLGFADTSAYGCARVPCPHTERLAEQGLLFTDAHSTHSVCTPSRYSLLTGEYAWRRRGTGILPGDAKLILPTAQERPSLPALLRRAGYRTAAIGKWHLGLGRGRAPINWNAPIAPGPNEVGFDHSFIMAATGDRVPCVFLRNGCVVGADPADPIEVSYRTPFAGEPLGSTHPELLKPYAHSKGPQHNGAIVDGIPRIGFMRGGRAALWKDQDIADRLTDEAIAFIADCARQQTPFFLYFAANDIHVPRDPHPRFVGRSGLGIRGDVTVQMDACLGRLRAALEAHGYADSLIILSSDNGPVIDDGYDDGALRDCAGHNPVAPMSMGRVRDGKLEGGKYGIMEGSTRVPLIVCWPGHTRRGRSAALVSQVDFARTLAELVGAEVPEGALPDSRNCLPALLGQDAAGVPELIESNNGGCLAIRRGRYKYYRRGETDYLFDLEQDLGEQHNKAAEQPELTAELRALLQERTAGKATP